ncbi:hypothetical protein [Aliarcobacter butzleri]|uniref:hypothetical protein n=1 Tax=Aliarcobacter butzleri TaxID=28197 RepID=UPI001EDB8F3D|nr:hypothetical protein [Aliarcobacter butzleri]MCG3690129.1 hypothetical protein [Aliarcobacter butzleri]
MIKMVGIHTLSDVKKYLKDKSFTISDERLTKYYGYIKKYNSRVDDKDKQWIAYSSQDYERTTAISAIKKISDNRSFGYPEGYTNEDIIKRITSKVDLVGTLFETKKITHKPRIPFYVLVLDKLLK